MHRLEYQGTYDAGYVNRMGIACPVARPFPATFFVALISYKISSMETHSRAQTKFLMILVAFGYHSLGVADYFKCVAPDGSLLYQSKECPANYETHVLEIRDRSSDGREPISEDPTTEDYRQYLEDGAQESRSEAQSRKIEREYDAATRKSEAEYRRNMCANATRGYGVYANGQDWARLTRGQREDPNILYHRDQMEQYCD